MADKFVTFDDQRPRTGLSPAVDAKIDGRYATKAELSAAVIGTGGVVSPSVSRIIASSDPDTPLNEGDLLLVYAPPHQAFRSFSTMDGLSPWWAGGSWTIADDESADGGHALQLTGLSGRRLLSLDDADGIADVEVVARIKVASANFLGGGLAVRASGTAGSESGYGVLVEKNFMRIVKFMGGTYSVIASRDFAQPSANWYWVRFRAQGPTLQASVWLDSDPEPSDWSVSATDHSISGGGWTGPLASSLDVTQMWDVFGVAELDTGSEKAPVAP